MPKKRPKNFLELCFLLFYCFSKASLFFAVGHINGNNKKKNKEKRKEEMLVHKGKHWMAFRAFTHTPQAVDFLQSIGLVVPLIEILWQERRIKLLRLSKRTSILP